MVLSTGFLHWWPSLSHRSSWPLILVQRLPHIQLWMLVSLCILGTIGGFHRLASFLYTGLSLLWAVLCEMFVLLAAKTFNQNHVSRRSDFLLLCVPFCQHDLHFLWVELYGFGTLQISLLPLTSLEQWCFSSTLHNHNAVLPLQGSRFSTFLHLVLSLLGFTLLLPQWVWQLLHADRELFLLLRVLIPPGTWVTDLPILLHFHWHHL